MKGISILAVLLVGSPLMATVSFSLVDNGDLTADLVMVCEGDDLDALGNSRVAGLALDVAVDAGQILDVFNYKTTGESVVGDKGFGIFPSSIFFTDPVPGPVEIADTGTPAVGDMPSNSVMLEFGALYDQGVPAAAPEATTVLCTMQFSGGCTVSLAVNATWGGVVLIGGGSPGSVDLGTSWGIAEPEPGPWCWTEECPCQQWGDANCDCQITAGDVQILLQAWGAGYNPCGDFNRDGVITAGDVQILIGSWTWACPVECEPGIGIP